MVERLFQNRQSGIARPINKVRGITQVENENPLSFYDRLEEVFRKYANIDPSSR
jgi:hypothetical protein